MKNLLKIISINSFILCLMSFCILLNNEVYAYTTDKSKVEAVTSDSKIEYTNSSHLNTQGRTLKYGDKYFIKNHYGEGSYLETCGHGKCTAGTKYNVTTHTEPDRGGAKTGTWFVFSATGKTNGTDVLIGDIVYLKNEYGGGTYLETCGHGDCTSGTKYNVTTHTQANRGGHSTGKWQIISTTGVTTGSQVKTNNTVYLKNIYGGGTYLETCGHGDCTSGTKYNVTTHTQSNRGGFNTGKWSFQRTDIKPIAIKSRKTNTVYSANGDAVMKYKYKVIGKTYNTECSVPDFAKDANLMQTEKYMEIFAPACHQHDLNYRAPWRLAGFSGYSGKVVADEKFHSDMKNICNNANNGLIEKGNCNIIAGIWYQAVKDHGYDAFDDGQKTAEADCDPNTISKGGYISVYSDAGYVTQVKVNYLENGKRVHKSGKLTALQTKEFPIPIGARDINLSVEGIACGLSFSKKYPNVVTKQFKVWGTIFDTEWKEL